MGGLRSSTPMLGCFRRRHDTEYSFVRILGYASKTLVAVATIWFYRRLEAYSFVRLSEGA
jgi:hypothetical protein